ncbi:hypothetical protein MBRA1_003474 [Malassezia brasiliensis]|uniref:Uncharacterized protein n=1 Tax=Malassezia brasiliensis TaxID=1821822 RepID=A0AAF0IR80_9BASI|nr:hypothetical protein MBRA1_003474 [Malassezia brasiliensis]
MTRDPSEGAGDGAVRTDDGAARADDGAARDAAADEQCAPAPDRAGAGAGDGPARPADVDGTVPASLAESSDADAPDASATSSSESDTASEDACDQEVSLPSEHDGPAEEARGASARGAAREAGDDAPGVADPDEAGRSAGEAAPASEESAAPPRAAPSASGAPDGAPDAPDGAPEVTGAEAPPFPRSSSRPAPARGILRDPPSESNNALWLGKELVYSLNSRLAQQNLPSLPMRMPVSTGGAMSVLSGVFRRLSSTAAADVAQLDAGGEASGAERGAPRRAHVHFRVEDLVHTYPIARAEAPHTEQATRARVEHECAQRMARLRARAWTPSELQGLYRMCCRAREEVPHAAVLAALEQAATWTDARALDLTAIDLQHGALPLADMLGAPMGLTRLVLEDCNLSDVGAEAVLRALRVAPSVRVLSVACNPLVRARGWDALGSLIAAGVVENVDVSENALSKAAVRAILARPTSLQTVRMEQCGLRAASLEAVAAAVRASRIRHVSLRRNHIGGHAVGALALLLRDIDDRAQPYVEASELHWHRMSEPTHELYGVSDAAVARALLHGTPVRRTQAHEERRLALQREALAYGAKLARLPHCGALQTLDVKGNALRTHMAPFAAAVRRNATLRVLSVSDNELDAPALALLADALRYNTTLETLDVSHNPCGGANLVGVLRLREALGVHPKLRRVFLAETQLTAEGAVALAECLPDAKHLLHLDVAHNPIGRVGLMALNTGLATNAMLRCLDVSVDAHDAEQVALAQKMYAACLAHADAARDRASTEAARKNVYTPLRRSALAAALQGSPAPPPPPAADVAQALARAQGTLVPEGAADAQRVARAELQRALEHAEQLDEDTWAEAFGVLDQLATALQASEPPLALATPRLPDDARSNPAAVLAEGLLSEEGEVFRRAKTLEAHADDGAPADEAAAPAGAAAAPDGAPLADKSGEELRQAILEAANAVLHT